MGAFWESVPGGTTSATGAKLPLTPAARSWPPQRAAIACRSAGASVPWLGALGRTSNPGPPVASTVPPSGLAARKKRIQPWRPRVGAAGGLLVGVGVGVGLPVGVGVAVGNGDAAPDAKRHPESTAATSGSVTIGPVRRVLRREVTTTSTRELAETWMTVRRLVFVRP